MIHVKKTPPRTDAVHGAKAVFIPHQNVPPTGILPSFIPRFPLTIRPAKAPCPRIYLCSDDDSHASYFGSFHLNLIGCFSSKRIYLLAIIYHPASSTPAGRRAMERFCSRLHLKHRAFTCNKQLRATPTFRIFYFCKFLPILQKELPAP